MTSARSPRGKRATRDDVARLAGVSGGAVSAALNGARGNIQVSSATRERIEAAAEKLGYRANAAAQSLRRQGTRTLGLVVPRLTRHSYVQSVPTTLGFLVREAVIARGYDVVELIETGVSAAGRGVHRLPGSPLAGLIIVSTDSDLPELADDPMPIVQVLRPREGIRSATLMVDPRPGFRDAVAHLTALGHERIAYVGANEEHQVDRLRVVAFHQAMTEAGLRVEPRHILLDSYSVSVGVAAIDAFLDSAAPPTAVIAGADLVAFGLLKGCYARRLRVPDDLSIVSYDDILADLVPPSLTTISQPLGELADVAVDMLLEMLKQPSASGPAALPKVSLPSQLHVRESTGVASG